MNDGAWVELDENGTLADPTPGVDWSWLPSAVRERDDLGAAVRAGTGSVYVGVGEGMARSYWRLTVTRRGARVRFIATMQLRNWAEVDRDGAMRSLGAAEGVGHLFLDFDGYIASADPPACAILGVSEDAAPGRRLQQGWVEAASQESFGADMRRAARGEDLPTTTALLLPDGSVREVELFLVQVRAADGLPAGLLASIRDVTVSREAARLQNLDTAMYTVSRVIADAAHGVNNLAARMLAVCERAARDDDPASFGNALNTMQQLAVQLGDVGREMLWVANPGATAGPSDLGKLAQELGRFMRRVAGPEGAAVEVHAIEGLHVVSAPDVFIRAVSAFALRALDLSRAARTPVHVDAVASGGMGLLRLRYQAPIGELTLLQHVLQYHTVAGTSALSAKEGLVFRAVAGTSGGIALEITAPIASLPAPSTGTSLSGRSTPRGRLLIADDEVDLRDLYADILSPSFSEVVKVGDGQAAWEWLEALNGEFALVLLDLRMPRIDGMDVLRRARERWPRLRVIVVSGAAPDGVVQSAMAGGARHVLSKPFTIRELRAVVRAALADVSA